MQFSKTLAQLRKENGRAPQPKQASHLALKQIKTAEGVFQPRNINETYLASDGHVKLLVDAVKQNGAAAFDPLTVWWSGSNWYVIDGHHRLMAFETALRDQPNLKIESVPVAVFAGSLNEAIIQSVALNAKDKLPMRKADKLERAWKLVCLDDGMSKRQIHDATTIAERTIATMRTRRKEIVERGEKPLEWAWSDVLADKRPEQYDETWEEKQAQDWVRRFVKEFGTKLVDQPEIAARALKLYSDRLPLELVRCWPEEASEVAEEEN